MFETQPNFEVEQANKGGQIQDGLANHSVMRMWGPALMVCLIVTSGLVSAFRSVDRGNAHAPLQCTGSFRPTSVHPVTAGSISLSTAAAFLVLPTLLVKAVFSNLFEKKSCFLTEVLFHVIFASLTLFLFFCKSTLCLNKSSSNLGDISTPYPRTRSARKTPELRSS